MKPTAGIKHVEKEKRKNGDNREIEGQKEIERKPYRQINRQTAVMKK